MTLVEPISKNYHSNNSIRKFKSIYLAKLRWSSTINYHREHNFITKLYFYHIYSYIGLIIFYLSNICIFNTFKLSTDRTKSAHPTNNAYIPNEILPVKSVDRTYIDLNHYLIEIEELFLRDSLLRIR